MKRGTGIKKNANYLVANGHHHPKALNGVVTKSSNLFLYINPLLSLTLVE
jgi:hypothetical protein